MVKFGGRPGSGAVKVLADPRSRNSVSDWQERWAAINRAGAVQEAAATAIHRIVRARADVDSALARQKQAAEDKRDRERQAASKPERAPLPPSQAGSETDTPTPLARAAEKLKKGLDEIEKRLWNRPDAQGLRAPDDILDQLSIVQSALGGQWDPPSATQLEALRQVDSQRHRLLADFNRFFAGEAAAFRNQPPEQTIPLLPDPHPVTL